MKRIISPRLHLATLQKHTLQHLHLYWSIRQHVQKLIFSTKKTIYTVRSKIETSSTSFRILKQLASIMALQATLAAGLITALELTEHSLTQASGTLQTTFPSLFIINIDRSIYVGLLSTLLQIYGVFLGLYFATVSIVASTAYARVPTDVRAIVIDDKFGNIYLHTVALTATGTAILLAAASLGWKIGVLNLYLSILLAALAILCFKALGSRAFHFFDPATLATHLNSELVRWTNAASPRGFNWLDRSFQHHYRTRAEQTLRTYGSVIGLAEHKENSSGRALVDTTTHLLAFIEWYTSKKPHIPSQSEWFPKTNKHTNWFAATATEAELALNTNTIVHPKEVRALDWIESDAAGYIHTSLLSLVSQSDYRSASPLALAINSTITKLTHAFSIKEALSLLRILQEAGQNTAPSISSPPQHDHQTHDWLLKLSLVDTAGRSIIDFIIATKNCIEALGATQLDQLTHHLSNNRPDRIYEQRMPRTIIERAEQLSKGIAFEQEVENKTITTHWYLRQELAIVAAHFGVDIITTAIVTAENFFDRETRKCLEQGFSLTTCHLASRGLESCTKLRALVSVGSSWISEIGNLRKQRDSSWPTPDWDSYNIRIKLLQARSITTLSRGAIKLGHKEPNNNAPDYLGQAYFNLVEMCYASMAHGDLDSFTGLFKEYQAAYWSISTRLRTKALKSNSQSDLAISLQPLREALELSGYSLAFSILHGKDFWTPVMKIWGQYFSRHKNRSTPLAFIAKAYNHFSSPFQFKPGEMRHIARQQDFVRQASARGWATDHYSRPPSSGNASEMPALFRALQISSSMLYNIETVFVAMYLFKYNEAKDIPWAHELSDFIQALHTKSTR